MGTWNTPTVINNLINDLPDNLTGLNQLTVQQNSTFLSDLSVGGTFYATTGVVSLSIITNVSVLNVSGSTKLNGSTTVVSSLNVSGDTIINDLYLPNLSGASSLNLALSTDNSGKVISINVGGGTLLSELYVSGSSNLVGNTSINSNLNVSGSSTFESNNLLKGATTIGSTLNISGLSIFESTNLLKGATTIGSTLNISGSSIFESTNLLKGASTINSTLNISGSTILESILLVKQPITASSSLTILGAQTNLSSLNVSGISIFNSDVFLNTLSGSSILACDAAGKIIQGSIPGSSGTVFSALLVSSGSTLSPPIADFRNISPEAYITVGHGSNTNSAMYLGFETGTSQLVIGQRGIARRMVFNCSGNSNIGIQTTNPSNGALEVRGTGTIAWGDNNGFIKVGAGSTAGFLENMSGQTRIWIPQATNRIGINNTSPAYVIHATDTTRGIMRLNTTTAGTAGVPTYDGIQLFSTTSSGEFGLYSEGNNTNDRVYIRNGADSGIGSNTSGIVIDSSNNVGIKRNSPSYPLDVNGTINSTNLRTNGYIQVFGKVASDGTATFSSNQTITVAKGSGNGYYYMQYNSDWDVGNVMMFTPDNALNIYTITAERSGGGSPSLGIYVYDGTNTRADLGFFFMGWVKI